MQERDHNKEYQNNEERSYAYEFDYVLREYILTALKPYFQAGRTLELGCFEGEMTKMLATRFDDLTVFEAASDLIEVARAKVPASVRFVHTLIETAEPEQPFDNIFLVHTLEHLDDPIGALKRIGSWLSDKGRLFVVVPNANAASRQIAVKMGLISHNQAVTPGEKAHGHRCTYSLDTLEAEVLAAGLEAETRGGVFFKPLANFQLDKAMATGLVDQAFLDGCYRLGMVYPDMCASIFTVCRKANLV